MAIQIQCISIGMNTWIPLRKLCLTAQAVNTRFPLHVPIFEEESIPDRLKSRYSVVRYAFPVKGFCALFSGFEVLSWLVMTFKTRSGTKFHGFTSHLDCEQSVFFFWFSKGSACVRARERWAAKPWNTKNEGGSPRGKKRDCSHSQTQWNMRWPHNAKYDWLMREALTRNWQ